MIQATNLCKRYGHGAGQVVALDQVDLDIGRSEFVAIIGPSGSGKSTLLLTLGGLVQPTEGKVYLGDLSIYDQDVTQRALLRRHCLGFMFQTFNLIPYLTALDNVQVPLAIAGCSAVEQRSTAEELLAKVGLQHRMTHKPSALSVGERQRVALARALANRPSIILADEPTGNLDPDCAQEVFDCFHQLHREGYTIVMVTHDHHAASLAQRQIEIVGGRLLPNGACAA